MANSLKNRSYFSGHLPKFTKKELSRLDNSKSSEMLLKAAKYLKQSGKEYKVG
ncbi:hypothetical protein [Catenovulum agarivorans]|uniref:hypothetical protein n=1 Tax=Catenovulum agarivorans TaxID=1172192 RepID=UPI0002EDC673|nr:hypothetical protein [Catenovulum agarivorans]